MVNKDCGGNNNFNPNPFFSARNKRQSINFEFWTDQIINLKSSNYFTCYNFEDPNGKLHKCV